MSCDNLVDEQPISEIGFTEFWKTPNDAENGVAGAYDRMQKSFKANHYFWGEMRADNFHEGSGGATANNLELVFNDLTSGNDYFRWNNLYNLINQANLAIKYLPEIQGVNRSLLGEAYALRAFAYFHAIRVWGSVPVFTDPIENQNQELQRPRTNGTTIMNEVIIPDIIAAEGFMEQFANPYRFSKSSIFCLQAEVYMHLQDYNKAKEALDKFEALNEFTLTNSVQGWQNLFLNDIGEKIPSGITTINGPELELRGTGKIQSGSELILSINFDLLDTDRAAIYAIFMTGIPSFYISPALENKWRTKFPIDSTTWVNKYPTVAPQLTQKVSYTDNGVLLDSLAPVYGDWRYFLCREGDIDVLSQEIGEARSTKYQKTNAGLGFDDSDIVLYRYSGMKLLLAEAENRLGNTTKALELVNEIRTARMLPMVTLTEFGATIDDRENYILDERQLELLGEGKRWWDLMRTGKTIEVMNPILNTVPNGIPLTPQRIFSPIFDDHLIENPLLEQTLGYN
ncbi:hypothetical protein BST83_00855 [Polaribacter filamentus]|uniref:RagB/SusD family nutrient uptake outer membrane protein n=2 Tax=Polaribacter filamentus TaxID=53483 RepID=A0A2S7L2I9_9FLAO|nr:hypothetical protein BST83_00855 [Polaribacter filamentus]